MIESVSFTGGPSVTIKSHHNVGGLPERMHMKLSNPYANCSRTKCARWAANWLAGSLCRPPSVPGAGARHPHPGAITREKLDILRLADEIYIEENPPQRAVV